MVKETQKQEPEFDPWEGMEDWEAEGFDSKEEYDDFCAKSAEDPLYGYGDDILTMKELRELLKQEEYIPQGEDAKYPAELLLDEKTGMYYTDFFRDFRTHMVLGHILAVECMECENLDWERVTGGYNPYIIARFEGMCIYPIKRKDGKLVEEEADIYPPETFTDFFDWDEERAVWFADNLPVYEYLIPEDIKELHQALERAGARPIDPNGWKSLGHAQWDILTTDYVDVFWGLDKEDPYHTKYDVVLWDKRTCLYNFETIYEKRGLEVVKKLLERFRYEWRRIASFDEFELNKLSPTEKESFRYFLFEGMDYYVDEWSRDDSIKPATTHPVEPSKLKFEDVFSMRYRRTPEYERLLHFLEVERKEASNGDWARYALALSSAKIFVHSPKTFKSWLPRFCELFGRSVQYQDPNKLNRTQCQKDISVYLPDW